MINSARNKASIMGHIHHKVGSPAMPTRGMKEDEMRSIAKLIAKVIDNIKDEKVIEDVR